MNNNKTIYDYILTKNNNKFFYENIDVESIDLDDITHALSHINRYLGHTKKPFSVGEHTLLCYMLADELGYNNRELLLVLVHDFTEAYVGDCPSPLKKLLPKFSEIEENVEEAIYKKFNIEPPTEEEFVKVKQIDITALYLEMRDLTLHSIETFENPYLLENIKNDKSWVVNHTGIEPNEVSILLKQIFNDLIQVLEIEVK